MRKNNEEAVRLPHMVDPYRLLLRLTLSAGKAAELCGISRRQLCYWTDKGIIEAADDDGPEQESSRRFYGFAALHRAMLIKQEMDRGHSLHRAAEVVSHKLRTQADQEYQLLDASASEREEFLLTQAERLAELARRLRQATERHPGDRKLRMLAHALAVVDRELGEDDSVRDLLEHPEACQRLAGTLDELQALMEEVEAEPEG